MPFGRSASDVNDIAGIDIGLYDRVGCRTGNAFPDIEVGIQVTDGSHVQTGNGGLVIGDGYGPGEGGISGIGDQIAVVNEITHSAETWCRGCFI